MADTNNQDDNIDIDSDSGTIDKSSDIEEEDSDDEYHPQVRLNKLHGYCLLDKIILQRLKQNDSGIINLSISLRDTYFNSIDWKEDGYFIANNTHLKKLHISYIGTIGKIDYILGEEGHNLPTREQLRGLFSCIYRNSSIIELSFRSILIYDKFGGGLIEGLSGHPSLIRLEMGQAKLGLHHSLRRLESEHGMEIGCEVLGKLLKNPKSKLNDLRLPYCKLDDNGLGTLCDGLLGNSRIKRLCLYGNDNITPDCWRALSTVIQHPNCKLVGLDLHSTVMRDEGLESLGNALRGSSLKSLILGDNPSISSRVWQTLLNQLSEISVESLDLRRAKIDDDGLATLASIGTLKSLDLQCLHDNMAKTPTCWRSFFNSLQTRGAQLVKLDISGNKVGGSGASALGSLLNSMGTLKTLKMNNISYSDNESDNITSQGWQTLFTSLQDSNLDLVELKLSGNSIDDEGMQLLVRLVSRMTSLKYMNLSCNHLITPTGWLALSDYLQSPNFALETLDLDENILHDDTVAAFASALVQNNTLKSLDLDDCVGGDDNLLITERGWLAVSTLIYNKTSILETYNSNHTICKLGFDHDEMNLPDNLTSLLELNKNKDKAEVARQKILQTQFSTEDGDTSKMQVLLDMELKMLPSAIAWIGRPLPIGWEGAQVSGLSTMYNLTRRLPDLFDSSPQKKSSAAKRKRSV